MSVAVASFAAAAAQHVATEGQQTRTITLTIPARRVLFYPADAARALGIDHDSVLRHIKNRPSLFPPKHRGRYEWTQTQFEQAIKVLCSLSDKAREMVRSHTNAK